MLRFICASFFIISALLIALSFSNSRSESSARTRLSKAEALDRSVLEVATTRDPCASFTNCTSCLSQTKLQCKWCLSSSTCQNATEGAPSCKIWSAEKFKTMGKANFGIGLFKQGNYWDGSGVSAETGPWSDSMGDECVFDVHSVEITSSADVCPGEPENEKHIDAVLSGEFNDYDLDLQNFVSVIAYDWFKTVQARVPRKLLEKAGAFVSLNTSRALDNYLPTESPDYYRALNYSLKAIVIFDPREDTSFTFMSTNIIVPVTNYFAWLVTAPQGSYNIGFIVSKALYIPMSNSTVHADVSQIVAYEGQNYTRQRICGYVMSDKPAFTTPLYTQLYDLVLYLSIGIFLIVVIVTVLVVVFLGDRLKDVNVHKHERLRAASTLGPTATNAQEKPNKRRSRRGSSASQLIDLSRRFMFEDKQFGLLDKFMSVFLASDERITLFLGTDSWYLLAFQRMILLAALIITVVGIVVLIPVDVLSPKPYTFYNDLPLLSAASAPTIRFTQGQTYAQGDSVVGILWVHAALNLFLVLVFIVFLAAVCVLGRTKAQNKLKTDEYAVVIRNMRPDVNDKELLERHIREQCDDPNEFVTVNIVWKKHSPIYEQALACVELEAKIARTKKPEKLAKLREQLVSVQRTLSHLKKIKESWINQGFCFAIFSSRKSAHCFMREYRKRKSTLYDQLGAESWTAESAPPPGDVQWKNVNVNSVNRFGRRVLSSIITLVVIAVGLLFIYLRNSIEAVARRTTSNIDTLSVSNSRLLGSFLSLALNLMMVVIPPVVGWSTNFERYISLKTERKQYVMRLLVFMFLSYLLSVLFQQMGNYWEDDKPYHMTFGSISAMTVRFLVSKVFISKSIDMSLSIAKVFIARITQGIWQRPRYDYLYAYSLRVHTLLVMLFVGPLMPIVFVAGFYYLVSLYFLDRFLVLHLYRRSITAFSSGEFLAELARVGIVFAILQPLYQLSFIPRSLGPGIIVFYCLSALVIALVALLIYVLKKTKLLWKLSPLLFPGQKMLDTGEMDERARALRQKLLKGQKFLTSTSAAEDFKSSELADIPSPASTDGLVASETIATPSPGDETPDSAIQSNPKEQDKNKDCDEDEALKAAANAAASQAIANSKTTAFSLQYTSPIEHLYDHRLLFAGRYAADGELIGASASFAQVQRSNGKSELEKQQDVPSSSKSVENV